MLKTIAIDDEPIALDVVKELASKISFIQLEAVFTNAFEALHFIKNKKPDLLFLDIKMPDISGMELLKLIPEPPMTIFTTAYSEHAVKGFELNAVDYLLKPFSSSRFAAACERALELHKLKTSTLQGENDFIFIKSGFEKIKVALADILYVQSAGNYVQFILKYKKILSRLTMQEVTALLPAAVFIRTQRSIVVNINEITKLDNNNVYIGDYVLPISSVYFQSIETLLTK